jgi:replicative DNA helicase
MGANLVLHPYFTVADNKSLSNKRKTAIKGAAVAPGMTGIGKKPPQAVELEEAVLGACMLESAAVNAVIDILKPEAFYKDAHGEIFNAINALFGESEPVDLLTVTEQLRKAGVLGFCGGPAYVASLTDRVASSANVEAHARIVAQKYIQRELIRISGETIESAFEDTTDVFDLLDRSEQQLFEVAEGNIRQGVQEMSAVMRQVIDGIDQARLNKDGVSGVPTGFNSLDKLTGGWQRSDMVVLAARPGMGKTAFVLSMARNMAVDHDVPVAVFSLEMSSAQLVQRLVAAESELSSEKFRKGDLQDYEYQQLQSRIKNLAKAKLFIDDTPALSVFELRAKCRRLKQKHGISMVIIDYLQLMTAGGDNGKGNREQEISAISRSIKSIAKELDVPVIALSQLSRSVETRGGDKRPILSDLRESGAIEQDADIVCFIYRPEYYGITEDADGMDTENMGELIVAKHRNGGLDTVKLKFTKHLAKFSDYDAFADSPFDSGKGLSPNEDFANSGAKTMTVGSRMNEGEEESPF